MDAADIRLSTTRACELRRASTFRESPDRTLWWRRVPRAPHLAPRHGLRAIAAAFPCDRLVRRGQPECAPACAHESSAPAPASPNLRSIYRRRVCWNLLPFRPCPPARIPIPAAIDAAPGRPTGPACRRDRFRNFPATPGIPEQDAG